MQPMTDQQRQLMEQLVERLNQASENYYGGKGETMTDFEWDALFDQLKQLETETGVTLPDSPTQNVSDTSSGGQKEEHEFAALSLAKTKQPADLVKWAEQRPVWMSWKLDGLTLVVTYDDGRLTKVVTRGNGHTGTNITHLSAAINGIPQRIKAHGHLVIRGEAVISYDDFEQFVMESDTDYANPRNLASGSLTLKDIEEVRRRHINWIAFTLVHTDKDIPSWGDRMQWLDTLGFKTVERERIEHPTLEAIEQAIDRFTERIIGAKNKKDHTESPQASSLNTLYRKNPYPVDGLVMTFDDTVYAASGSVTGHHATRGGLAFKWQDETAQTVLDHIEWSCAASTISPVAVFVPVELEGTTVKRASLCNISECERLGIGERGTEIEVIKANKIIPKVVRVVRKEGSLQIPDECPVCGANTEIRQSEVSGTRTLHCTNTDCAAKKLKKFARFVSKEGMNIDGISEQTLSRFINLGWISEYADIYLLRNHIHAITTLEGFGERSATNMMRAIEQSRQTDAQRLLIALSIPKCGPDVCKRLLAEYSFDDLVHTASTTTNSEHFAHIDGIGPERSTLLTDWFHDKGNTEGLTRLKAQLTIRQQEPSQKGNNCQGLTFVVTGDVHHFSNRNELKSYIESQGGRVAGSVSAKTSYLINNDVTSMSGKNKKAQELGIRILSEEQFISMFGNKVEQPTEGSLF